MNQNEPQAALVLKTQSPDRQTFVRNRVIIIAITLFASCLRIYRADDSLWLDELHTSWVVVDGFEHIGPRAAIGNQSPLYFYATWLSTSLFGMNEIAVRLPSLIAGILLVPAVFYVVHHWTSSTIAATLAAILTSIDRDFLFYAQEARPYVVVQLVGLVQVFIFSQLITADEKISPSLLTRPIVLRILLIVTSVVLFYLHYTAALLFVGEFVFYAVLIATRHTPKSYGPKRMAVDFVFIAAFCLRSIVHLIEIADRRANWSAIAEKWPSANLLRFFDVYLLVPIVLLVLLLMVRFGLKHRPVAERPNWRVATLVLCWIIVPVGTAWFCMLSGLAPLTLLRYVMVSAIAPIIFASIVCAIVPNIFLRGILAGIIITAAVLTSDIPAQFQQDGRLVGQRNEDWRNAIGRVNQSEIRSVHVEPGLIDIPINWSRNSVFYERWDGYPLFAIRGMYGVDRPALDGVHPYWLIARYSDKDATNLAKVECLRWNSRPKPDDGDHFLKNFKTESYGTGLTLIQFFLEKQPRKSVQSRPTR